MITSAKRSIVSWSLLVRSLFPQLQLFTAEYWASSIVPTIFRLPAPLADSLSLHGLLAHQVVEQSRIPSLFTKATELFSAAVFRRPRPLLGHSSRGVSELVSRDCEPLLCLGFFLILHCRARRPFHSPYQGLQPLPSTFHGTAHETALHRLPFPFLSLRDMSLFHNPYSSDQFFSFAEPPTMSTCSSNVCLSIQSKTLGDFPSPSSVAPAFSLAPLVRPSLTIQATLQPCRPSC